MAEATALRNNVLEYPIYGEPYTVVFPMLDADGDLVTGATTPDSEISKNGDTFADCTNEATEIATSSGMYYLTLTATEMTADIVAIIAKSATSGMKTTPIVLYPRKMVQERSGTCAGGDTGYVTLDSGASGNDDYYNGCIVSCVIDSVREVRMITDYAGSTKQASVTPSWNTAPDSDDTFIVYQPEGNLSVLRMMMNKNSSYTFNPTSDSLEAIRDRGDAAWVTGSSGAASESYVHSASSTGIVIGDVDAGTIANIDVANGTVWDIGEVAGTITYPETAGGQGIRVEIQFDAGAGEVPVSLLVWGVYVGSAGHQINVYMYEYNDSNWELVGSIPNGTDITVHSFATHAGHINGSGTMQCMFHHSDGTGVASHYLRLDKVMVENQGAAVAGTVDANLVSIDGSATNDNSAILKLKQLSIVSDDGGYTPLFIAQSDTTGNSVQLYNNNANNNSSVMRIATEGGGKGLSVGTQAGDGIEIVSASGVAIDIASGTNGINITTTDGDGIIISASGSGKLDINAPNSDLGVTAGDNSDVLAVLGTPAGLTMSADIAAVYGGMALDSTVAKEATLGTPASTSVSSDISAIATTIGTPADTSVSTDIFNVALTASTISSGMALDATVAKEATLGTPADTDIATDIANLVTTVGTPITADSVLDEVVEGTYTMRQLLRLMASALCGKVSGGGTTTITFRDTGDTTNRIVATVDSNGNRTAITLTET